MTHKSILGCQIQPDIHSYFIGTLIQSVYGDILILHYCVKYTFQRKAACKYFILALKDNNSQQMIANSINRFARMSALCITLIFLLLHSKFYII